MKIKKTVSILLAVMMLVGILPMTTMAKNAYTVGTTDEALKTVREILFYEDFDGKAVGTEIKTDDILGDDRYYQLEVETESKATVKIEGNGTDNYLYLRGKGVVDSETGEEDFDATEAKKAYIQLQTFESSEGKFSGTYVTEFKWMQMEPENTLDLFQQRAKVGTSSKIGAYVLINEEKGIQYRNGSSTTQLKVDDVARFAYTGIWNNAKIVTNINAKTYDLYINNRLIESGIKYANLTDDVDCFFRPFYAQGIRSAVCYDDIIIYREAVDRTVWASEDFSGYDETRDWRTWQNEELAKSTKITGISNYSATDVDHYDTWLEGMELVPTIKNANGVIDSENDELKLNAGGKFILSGYGNNTSIKDGAGVSFTFRAENPMESHGNILRMREGNAKNIGVSLTLSKGAFMAETTQNNYEPIYEGVVANRDYHFTIWCERTTGKYTVYIDGKCVAAGLDYLRLVSPNTGNLYSFNDMARIFEVGISNTITGACYYDDITFFYDNRDNIAQKAMIEMLSEDGVKESIEAGETSIEFPEIASGYEGYTLNWTSSDASVVNPKTGEVTIGYEAKTVTLTAEVADANKEYTLKRSIEVRVPASVELAAKWNGESAVCEAKVNGTENYDGTKLLLAIYNNADGGFLGVKTGEIASGAGTVTLTPATALSAGDYTIKAYAWDTGLVPLCLPATAIFTVEAAE